jgi:mono/diheme cytochrome c family protein
MALVAVPAIALAQQAPASTDKGREVYEYWCATCHGRGNRFPGTNALQAKYGGKVPAVLDERTDLTPAAIRLFVRRGTSIMPFFRKTEVSDADLDAIGAYLTRPRAPAAPAGAGQ